MLENPELFEKIAQKRDDAWEGVISYVEARERAGAFRPVDARHLVEGFKSMVGHLAAEMICRRGSLDRQEFYDVVDTMINIILAGIKTEA
jgi:hypothetical protein